MRKLVITVYFAVPIATVLIFIHSAVLQGNPGFKIDKTQKGLLISKVFAPVNAVKEKDVLLFANGLSHHELLGFLVLRPPLNAPGTLTVLRGDQRMDLPLKTIPYTVFSLLGLIWPRLMLIAVLLTLGWVVIYKSPPDRVSLLFFLMLCSFSTALSATLPSTIALFSPLTFSFSFLLHAPLNWIAFGLWLHFALRFPEERDLIRNRWWIPCLIYFTPAVTTIGGAFYAAGLTPEFFGWIQRLRNLFLPVIIVSVFIKHALDYRKMSTPQERNRIKFPLIAYWLTFAPYLLFYLVPSLVMDTPLIPFRLAVFAFFVLPLAYCAGIIRYKLFKVDQIMSRTMAYFAIIIVLSIVYSLFFTVLKKWFFGDAVLSKEIFLIFLILMNMVFHPVIMRLDRLIRRLFFHDDAVSIKVMHQFSDHITATLDLPRIINSVTRDLPPAIQIRASAVMLLEEKNSRLFPEDLRFGVSPWPDSRLVRLFKANPISHLDVFRVDPDLEKEAREIQAAGFSLVLPLRTSKTLAGLLFIGPKNSGGLFSDADIHLLASFANQAAIALENAIHHESLVDGKKQLEQMFDQKVQSEKMAAIGEMTSILAHELKNPLGIIHSSAQYLSQGRQSKAVAQEMLDYILKEVEHLNLSINSILNLARQKPPEFSKVDLGKEVRQLLDQWIRVQDHNPRVEIHLHIQAKLPPVYADVRQLAQVLLNLVRNSEEMMPRGGEIRCEISQEGRDIQIVLTDTGPGIPEENLTQVFENFFTTKEQGLGLGLAACKQIIQAHNGTIDLGNRAEENVTGAIARVSLPIKPLVNMGVLDFKSLAMPA